MRKIREVLRLRFEAGLSGQQVAASLQMARSTVDEVLTYALVRLRNCADSTRNSLTC